MKTDIEIAREAKLKPITEVAQSVGIPADEVLNYGKYMAKLPLHLIDEQAVKQNNLILVTAITPTKAGIGKTTVSVGLSLALNRIGKRCIAALREPSLGPCFGMKGGAAGGGYSQVLPMENINLHFTGDFHAITSAHNMISALLDNYIYQNRNTDRGLKTVVWKRVLDVNDRALRNVVVGLGGPVNGVPRESGFDITPASEIMAVMCLATDLADLRRRIGNILLGFTFDGNPFTVEHLGVTGAITVLLKDALQPNLVQTTENTAAIVHGGPFANIAHGCNSIVATKMALSFAPYVITEAGFGADLGAEKFFDIKCRKAGLNPRLTIIVATMRSIRLHGGFENLDRHVENMRKFGQTVIVTFNRYADDTDQDIALVAEHCKQLGVRFAMNSVFADGGKGGEELARLVVDAIENEPSPELTLTYQLADPVREKIRAVATKIYGAASVTFTSAAEKKIQQIEELEYRHMPVCIAKTQYSFSTDPTLMGAPSGFNVEVRDVVINSGSEMIVAITGDIMRMPGLPKEPAALRINLLPNGDVDGLS